MQREWLYLAYGSNLNVKQMEIRCPRAKIMGSFLLPNYKLVFRGVADIEESEGDYCPVGLWKITRKCLGALDRYEGYPTLYRREDIGGCMTYMMNSSNYAEPSWGYLETIKNGYRDFDLPEEYLSRAVDHAVKNETRQPLWSFPHRNGWNKATSGWSTYEKLGFRSGKWWYE